MLFDIGILSKPDVKSRDLTCVGTSQAEFGQAFPTEAACFEHIFKMRYGNNPPCPNCGKTAGWYQMSNIRRFQHPCGYGIAPTAQTIFHNSKTPVQIWLYAMLHFTNSRSGVCTNFLLRQLGISHSAAFRMGTKIRTQMAALEDGRQVGGEGREVMVKIVQFRRVRTQGRRGAGRANIFSLADQDHIVNVVIGRSRRNLLRKLLAERVRPGSIITTNLGSDKLSPKRFAIASACK